LPDILTQAVKEKEKELGPFQYKMDESIYDQHEPLVTHEPLLLDNDAIYVG